MVVGWEGGEGVESAMVGVCVESSPEMRCYGMVFLARLCPSGSRLLVLVVSALLP